jgi:hypothetical protein
MTEQPIRLRREVPFGLIEFEQDPPGANGRQHRAYYVTADGQRKRYVSVSTFLGVLAKPALLRWYEEQGAKGALALERSGLLKTVAVEDAVRVLRDHQFGAEAAARAAAQRGTNIHQVLEDYAQTGLVPSPSSLPAEQRGYLRSLLTWILSAERRGLEIEATEQLVALPKLEYAGRYDLRIRLGGEPYLIDLKTNRQGCVWPEHHYQPVAYAMAGQACGEELPQRCVIVAVGPDGYEEMDCQVGPADVKAVLDCYRRVNRLDAAVQRARKAA